MGTRDTVAWVCGVSRCAKNRYHTHTHCTRFKSTAGLPTPIVILRNWFLSIDRHFMYIFTIGPLHGYWVWKGRAFVSEAADV